jgi:hypothetical protein
VSPCSDIVHLVCSPSRLAVVLPQGKKTFTSSTQFELDSTSRCHIFPIANSTSCPTACASLCWSCIMYLYPSRPTSPNPTSRERGHALLDLTMPSFFPEASQNFSLYEGRAVQTNAPLQRCSVISNRLSSLYPFMHFDLKQASVSTCSLNVSQITRTGSASSSIR